MVTKEQALTHAVFHYGTCKQTIGPRGGKKTQIEQWRANGRCQTWVTKPYKFSLPIKYGLYNHGYLTNDNADLFHVEENCPLNRE